MPPRPFDPACPRYLPDLTFPPYRHVPGQTPHPRTHPQGHSFGRKEGREGPPLTTENWWHSQPYLWGVDLYNYAYWWEAHEQWEELWHRSEPLCCLYLQGLVQTAAALIKWHQRNRRGAARLSQKGREKLERVAATHSVYLGLHLPAFLERLDLFFTAFPDPDQASPVYADSILAPLIRLRF